MKKFLSILLLCCMFISIFTISALAADNADAGIMPLYDNVSNSTLNMTFDSGICYVAGTANKKTGTTSMEGTIEMYEKIDGKWVDMEITWTNSTKRNTLATGGDFEAVFGREYKAVFTIVAYSPITTETIVMEVEGIYD